MTDTPDPFDVHLGRLVALRRASRGFSQDRLAKQIGVSFQQVQKYETAANRISASRLHRISQVLGVPFGSWAMDAQGETQALTLSSASNSTLGRIAVAAAHATPHEVTAVVALLRTLTAGRGETRHPGDAIETEATRHD